MPQKAKAVSEIINNIRRVFKVVNEHSKKAKLVTGITGPQLWAIKIIRDLSPVRVSDLAHRMYIHPATAVGILDRLESKGLVKRVRSKDDKRVVKVELTDVGKKLVRKAPEVAQGLLVAGLEVLTLKKLQNIAQGLDELVHILGAQKLPPRLILLPEVSALKKPKKE
ncbi:MAG TPA: MarR family transcriptional regulator [Syntrophales bacterium]|nr:MarR family transcriptional regulator [Syntrophales bacterium]